MSRLLGEARVSILPDDKRFKPEAEAKLKKASESLRATAKLGIKLDDRELQAKRAKIVAQIDELRHKMARVKVGIDDRDANAKLARINAALTIFGHRIATAKTDVDIANAEAHIAELSAQLHKFSILTPEAKARVDAREGHSALDRLKAALTIFSHHDYRAKASVDTNNIERGMSRVVDWIKTKFTRDVENAAGNAGNRAGHSMAGGLAKSTLFQNPGIVALVVAGFAALPAALGAVGVLGGIALGAGLIASAEKLINSQIKNLTSSIKQQLTGNGKLIKDQLAVQNAQNALATAGVSTKTANPFAGQQQQIAIQNKQLTLQNTQATITRLEGQKKITAAQQQQLVSAKARLVIEKQSLSLAQAQAATPVAGNPAAQNKAKVAAQGRLAVAQQQLKTDQATAKLNNSNQNYTLKQQQQQLAQYQAYQQAFAKLNNAIKNAKMSFAQFAIIATKPLLGPFTDAVNYLSSQMQGPLAKTFRTFFTAVGPLVKPVVQSLLEIVQGILPGMTAMLKQARGPLGDLFIKFGKIVGLRIGDWFRAATPYIKDSAHYFLALLNAVGIAGTYLVKFGGETAKAFSDPALKGFGPLIIKLADALIKILKPALEGWIEVYAPLVKLALQILVPIAQFLAANPKLVKAISAIAAAWLLAHKAMTIMIPVFRAFNLLGEEAVVSNPWIAVAAAVIIAAVLIVKYWKPITKFFIRLWNDIFSWLKQHMHLLIDIVFPVLGNLVLLIIKYHKQIWNVIQTVWHAIFNTVRYIWDHISNFVKGVLAAFIDIWKGAWGVVSATFRFVWNLILQIVRVIWAAIRDTFKVFLALITGNWKAAWNAIKDFFRVIWDAIKNIVHDAVSWVASVLKTVWNTIKNVTRDIWNGIKGYLNAVWNSIKQIASTIWNAVVNFFRSVWNTLKNDAKNDWNIFKGIIIGVWNGIKNVSGKIWAGIVSAVKTAWNAIKAVVAKPINVAIGFINTLIGGADAVLSTIGIHGHGPHNGPIPNIPKIPGFRSGGKVNSGTHETADDILVRVSKNETIVSAEHSRKLAPYFAALGVPGYAKGGIPSLAGYVNPIPAGVRPERIDQGVDFAGSGPIKAIGPARIIETGGSGWPGGPYMSYQLLGGAMKGLNVYVAENIRPVVRAGQTVKAGQHIADMFDGGTGIETGFAAPGGSGPLSQTAAAGSISGANLPANGATQVGELFDELLVSLGAPRAPNFGLPSAGKIPGSLGGNGGNLLSTLANLAKKAGGGLVGFVVNTIADLLQVSGIPAPVTGAISSLLGLKTPNSGGKGFIGELANGMPKFVLGKTLSWLKTTAFDALKKVFAPQIAAMQASPGGGAPAGGATGTSVANGRELYNYLLTNLFSGHPIAAAGATASIWGESLWNPSASGSGGRGLIGWTPPSLISDADFRGGMRTQLPDIIKFVHQSGDMGTIARMMQASSVAQAAQEWMVGVERAGKSDVHSTGLQLATSFMSASGPAHTPSSLPFRRHAQGGFIPGYAPGRDTVPAMLSPGEYVLNPRAVKAIGLSNLHALNKLDGGRVQGFANGGTVQAPTLQQEHDAAAHEYHKFEALRRIAIREHNIGNASRYGKEAAKYAREIASIDNKLHPRGISEEQKLRAIKDPVLRMITYLNDRDLLAKLAYQMEFHSLNPAPTGGLSHRDMARFAMQVTPDVLNNLYTGNVGGLAHALEGGLTNPANFGVFGQSSRASLSLLGKLSGPKGIHGIYAGVRFSQGGAIHEPIAGFGLRTGLSYSFGEGGRRERVLTDAQSQQYENQKHQVEAVRQQNRLLAEQNALLARIVNNTGNTAKSLGGTGRGVL